jgi:hypothetical protein
MPFCKKGVKGLLGPSQVQTGTMESPWHLRTPSWGHKKKEQVQMSIRPGSFLETTNQGPAELAFPGLVLVPEPSWEMELP